MTYRKAGRNVERKKNAWHRARNLELERSELRFIRNLADNPALPGTISTESYLFPQPSKRFYSVLFISTGPKSLCRHRVQFNSTIFYTAFPNLRFDKGVTDVSKSSNTVFCSQGFSDGNHRLSFKGPRLKYGCQG